MENSKKQDSETLILSHLSTYRDLLISKAQHCETLAKLWATDPAAYGTSEAGIKEWEGVARAYREVAKNLSAMFNI